MPRLHRLYLPLLTLFAALGAWRSIASPDAFWHLASGRWMLEHGAVPRHDPFRFTSGGVAWVDHEWGFQLLLGLAERLGGLGGLVAFRALLFALLAWILWRLAMRTSGASLPKDAGVAAILAFCLIVVLDGLHGRMPLRPELLTLVFFACLLWLLDAARERQTLVWLAVPGTALWVNVHPGALLVPGIVFLHLLGRRLERGLARSENELPPRWRQIVGAPAACFVALGANPWGFEVVWLPLRIRSALADLPATNPDWRKLWDDPPHLLLGLLGLTVLATLHLRSRHGTWRVDLPSALVLASTVGLMGTAVRFQGLVWIALLAFVGRALRRTPDKEDVEDVDAALVSAGRRFAPVVALMLVAGVGVEGWRAVQAHVGVAPGRFPEAGVTALQAWDAESGVGPLFHSAVFGGYVLYRAFPPRQIFVDTRNEVDPDILRQIAAARSDARAWRDLVDRYGLDAALVRYEDRPRQVLGPPSRPGGEPSVELHTTSALLFPPDDWSLVHWDDVSMLFLRRTEARAERLAGREYRFVQPENVDATLRRAARDPAFRAGLRTELLRKLGDDPDSHRAARLLQAVESMDVDSMDPAVDGKEKPAGG